jgi:hypothetical protein
LWFQQNNLGYKYQKESSFCIIRDQGTRVSVNSLAAILRTLGIDLIVKKAIYRVGVGATCAPRTCVMQIQLSPREKEQVSFLAYCSFVFGHPSGRRRACCGLHRGTNAIEQMHHRRHSIAHQVRAKMDIGVSFVLDATLANSEAIFQAIEVQTTYK